MPDLEPITREEMLLDGEDLTPITRKEQFIKRIYDKTQEIPEPITREEMFLKKAGEGGGGDIDLQTLNVTENGTVNAPSGVAYNKVVTDVPQPTMTKLTATENRTYTAPSGTAYNEVDVDVPLPSNAYLLKELSNLPQPIASFNDGSDNPLKSLTASIVPVQDLHGYDHPWAGGAGKNKCPMTVDGIKNTNTSGTWSGNVYTINGGTFTILTDSENNVTGIKVNGTFNANTLLTLGTTSLNGSYILNGCPNGGYMYTYRMDLRRSTGGDILYTDEGSGVNINNINESVYVVIRIQGQYQASNLVFLPMIRLSTETDPTFAPYSNICPISGWTEEVVTVADDTTSPTVEQTYTIPFTDSQGNPVEVYGGSVDVVNGGGQPNTKAKIDLYTLDWTYQSNNSRFYVASPSDLLRPSDNAQAFNGLCSAYLVSPYAEHGDKAIAVTTTGSMFIFDTDYTDATALKTFLQNNNVQLVYELATPTTFYTQPTSIKSLDGENNLSASTGDVEELKYFSKEV